MLAGGSEAAITPLGIAGFCSMRAMSTRNDAARAREPALRQGPRRLRHGRGRRDPRARGARARPEARRQDLLRDRRASARPPTRSTSRRPRGEGRRRPALDAARDGGRRPARPRTSTYINAHGTSTPINDPNETAAIKAVLGDRARKVMVSSTKSMIGHLLGASARSRPPSARCRSPATSSTRRATYENPDPQCDLDYVPRSGARGEARRRALEQPRLRRPQRHARVPALLRLTRPQIGSPHRRGLARDPRAPRPGARLRSTSPALDPAAPSALERELEQLDFALLDELVGRALAHPAAQVARPASIAAGASSASRRRRRVATRRCAAARAARSLAARQGRVRARRRRAGLAARASRAQGHVPGHAGPRQDALPGLRGEARAPARGRSGRADPARGHDERRERRGHARLLRASTRFFGLPKDQVRFFTQGMLPAVDETGKARAPRAGTPSSSARTGTAAPCSRSGRAGCSTASQKEGVEELFYFQVDNPARRALRSRLPRLSSQAQRSEFSSKVVAKAGPDEKVGVLAESGRAHGADRVQRPPAGAARGARPDGSLVFSAGNIAIHVLALEFVRRLTRGTSAASVPPRAQEARASRPPTARRREVRRDQVRDLHLRRARGGRERRSSSRSGARTSSPRSRTRPAPTRPRRRERAPVRAAVPACSKAAGVRVPAGRGRRARRPIEISPLFAADAGGARARASATPPRFDWPLYLETIDMTALDRVAVLCGGSSSEHPVSLKTGATMVRSLVRAGFEVTPVVIGKDGDVVDALGRARSRHGLPKEVEGAHPKAVIFGTRARRRDGAGPAGDPGRRHRPPRTRRRGRRDPGFPRDRGSRVHRTRASPTSALAMDKVLLKLVLRSAPACRPPTGSTWAGPTTRGRRSGPAIEARGVGGEARLPARREGADARVLVRRGLRGRPRGPRRLAIRAIAAPRRRSLRREGRRRDRGLVRSRRARAPPPRRSPRSRSSRRRARGSTSRASTPRAARSSGSPRRSPQKTEAEVRRLAARGSCAHRRRRRHPDRHDHREARPRHPRDEHAARDDRDVPGAPGSRGDRLVPRDPADHARRGGVAARGTPRRKDRPTINPRPMNLVLNFSRVLITDRALAPEGGLVPARRSSRGAEQA